MSRYPFFFIAGGLFTGAIFCAANYDFSGGIITVYLPMALLLLGGLSHGSRHVLIMGLAALPVVAGLSGLAEASRFLGAILLPVYYFNYKALLKRGDEWYPALRILAEITLIIAFVFLLSASVLNHSGGARLKDIVAQEIIEDLQGSNDAQTGQIIDWVHSENLFLLVGWMMWFWIGALFLVARLSNRYLAHRGRALRPSLAFTSRGLPALLLPFLFLCGAWIFVGNATGGFTAKTLFFILALPYVVCGGVALHERLRGAGLRWLWLGFFYTTILLFQWPVILLLITGLYTHVSEILDRRAGIR